MEVLVEPGLEAELPHLKAFNLSEQTLAEQVDFIVTLGGDGTILYVNSLFSAAIPPILSFNLGSLGFLTPFRTNLSSLPPPPSLSTFPQSDSDISVQILLTTRMRSKVQSMGRSILR